MNDEGKQIKLAPGEVVQTAMCKVLIAMQLRNIAIKEFE